MSVLLTRPVEDSARIAARLNELGFETLTWPLSRIEPVGGPVIIDPSAEAIAVTSANAARRLAASDRKDVPVLAVGERTASVARSVGFKDVKAASGDVIALVELVKERALGKVFYPRAEQVSRDLRALLADVSCQVVEQVVYRACPGGEPDSTVDAALSERRISAVTIWSRRNTCLFGDYFKAHTNWRIGDAILVGISSNAAEPLETAGFRRIEIAETANADGMIAGISAALR